MKILNLLLLCFILSNFCFLKALGSADCQETILKYKTKVAQPESEVPSKIVAKESIILTDTTWLADTVIVNHNISVPNDVTLTISSGTQVKFMGRYSIIVEGALVAEGSINDSISFYAEDMDAGWSGIQFLDDDNYGQTKDSSYFNYCSISDIVNNNTGRECIYFNNYSKVKISNCNIFRNSCRYGVFRCTNESNPTIINCMISNNEGSAISCDNSSPSIIGNYVLRNGRKDPPFQGGAIALRSSKAQIINNVIAFNKSNCVGAAITVLNGSNPIIINNNICYNHEVDENGQAGGIYFDKYSHAEIINCILWGNTAELDNSQVMFYSENLNPVLRFCVLERGEEGILGEPRGSEKLIMDNIYLNCLEQHPGFIDGPNSNFNLSSSSICINAGVVDTTGLLIPKFDIDGNSRVSAGRVDIGALEYQGAPDNRKPKLQIVSKLDMLTNSSVEMEICFVDQDVDDEHSFSVSSNNQNVKIEDLAHNQKFPTYRIVSSENWSGNVNITVTIDDNSGAQNSQDSYVFPVSVGDFACGLLTGKTTWSRDTVKVNCDITIAKEGELVIQSGTVVEFLGYNGITVNGKILALGTTEEPITFFTRDTLQFETNEYYTGWKGINFIENMRDTSVLNNSILSFASTSDYNGEDRNGAAILLEKYNMLIIRNCSFEKNKSYFEGGAICGRDSKLSISKSIFKNNKSEVGGAIALFDSELELFGDTIYSNNTKESGAGLYLRDTKVISENNLVANCTDSPNFNSPINIVGGSLKMFNNIICNNSGGIYIEECPTEINNCVIYNNASYPLLIWRNSNSVVKNCIINGVGNLSGVSNIMYSILDENFPNGEYNLVVDPGFVDPTLGIGAEFDALEANWELKSTSYAIDQGDSETNVSEFVVDFAGNNRLYGDGIDIGAFEFQRSPGNRRPIILGVEDVSVASSSLTEIVVNYWDPDKADSHDVKITSDNENVLIQDVVVDSNQCLIYVQCANDWEGEAIVSIKITDSSGSDNSTDSETFIVQVSNLVCGHIKNNTVWEAEIIEITCNTIIDDNITLEIKAGTKLLFRQGVTLEIIGRLIAKGFVNDTISFSSIDNDSRWGGIMIKNGFYAYGHASGIMNDNDTSLLTFCKIENINGTGLFIDNYSKVVVENSRFTDINGSSIHMYESSPLLKNNVVENSLTTSMESGTIWAERYSGPLIINNIIRNNDAINGGGISCDYNSPAVIVGNLIYNNTSALGGGVYCSQSAPIIYNNTIVKNFANDGGGIYGRYSVPQIMNTIIWDNNSENNGNQLFFNGSIAPKMSFCFIANEDRDRYFSNQPDFSEIIISKSPEFDTESKIYELSPNSSCINTGSSVVVDDIFPRFDLLGNGRKIDSLDIGALEFQGKPNELPPLDFFLSETIVEENQPVGVNVGQFLVLDPNVDEVHDFRFIAGNGQNDRSNDEFVITLDSLKTNRIFDFENEVNKQINVELKDELYGLTKSFSIEIKNLVERPILITPLPDMIAYVDSFFYFEIPDSIFSTENDFYRRYRASVLETNDLPPWLSFGQRTGVFSGTPSFEATYDIVISVIDWHGYSAEDTIRLEVRSDNLTSKRDIDVFDWEIYPNPATDNFMVSSSKLISTISVCNIFGKTVYFDDNIDRYKSDIDVANLPSGIYFVIINKDHILNAKKIILR